MSGSERDFRGLLQSMIQLGASDLHLKAGSAPTFRIDGVLFALDEPKCTPSEMDAFAQSLASEAQYEHFQKELESDVAVSLPGVARFRVNLCSQRGSIGLSFRLLPTTIPSIDELGLPQVLHDLIQENRGLILITGATGTGKSTTVASMIDALNHSSEGKKIVTVEDPIEYLHRDDVCLIYQREIGPDSHSFAHALRHVLRQDPDIIMVGEIRDLETLNISLMAANTGHLVLSTLHTADAVQTINRILSNYSPHEQEEVRRVLADNLRAVISQRLIRRVSGKGRVAAVEVMITTDTIKDLIADGSRTPQIRQVIQEGVTQYRMQSFDQALAALVARGEISSEEGIRNATRPHELALHIQGFSGAGSRGWGPNTVAPEASEKTPPPPPPEPDWLERAA